MVGLPLVVASRRWRRVAAVSYPAVLAVLRRDIFVTVKEYPLLLIQVAVIPTFLLFVFTRVLTGLGYVRVDFNSVLLPGIVALSAFLTALHSVAYPLLAEFAWTKQIEDQLFAPLPIGLLAAEKIFVGALRGLLAATCMLPISVMVTGSFPLRRAGLPLLLLVLVLGSWVGAAIGVLIATATPAPRAPILFQVFLPLLPFTGAVQYPLLDLGGVRWFQAVNAGNPLTYCSEGARAALVPAIRHLDPSLSVSVLVGSGVLFTVAAVHAFRRRAMT